jgi:hypothetical protein
MAVTPGTMHGSLTDSYPDVGVGQPSRPSRWIRPTGLANAMVATPLVLPPIAAWSINLSPAGSNGTAPRSQKRPSAPRSDGGRPSTTARVVTQSCQWCRQPLGPRNHSGRRRVYCSQSCRQRAYQSRKRSKQLGLKEGELLVSSVLLARMNRRLQALEAALREVEMAELQTVDERIAKLCQAARRLRRMVVGPPTR